MAANKRQRFPAGTLRPKRYDMSLPRQILIAGIPSAGKTYYGDWLAFHHGFLHIDDLSGGRLRLYGLHEAWEHSLLRHDARPFIAELEKRDRPAMLNWGFPLDSLPFVRLLKHEGLALWWFDADVKTARREHIRNGRDAKAFDAQVADIAAHRTQIDTLFPPNVLQVLAPGGERMPPEAIFEAMSRSA
jgi:hypothetical protein